MNYIVKKNDTLAIISSLLLGNASKYLVIYNANPFIQGRKYNDLANDRILIEGESIFIPLYKTKNNIINTTNDISIYANGVYFQGWFNLNIELNLDTIANSFNFSFPYEKENELHNIFKRFSYPKIEIYFKGEIFIRGIAPIINIKSGIDSVIMDVKGYSLPGVLGEINLPPNLWPRKFVNMSFYQIAKKICEPFGFTVIRSNSSLEQSNILYKEIEINETETIASFLNRMANDRSCILNDTPDGNIYIDRIEKGKKEIFYIDKSKSPQLEINASYDGTKLFSDYFLLSSGDEVKGPTTSVFSFPINPNRPVNITQDESGDNNGVKKIENIAKKALSDAQVINSSLIGWVDDNGKIIKPGEVFGVVDSSLQIYEKERHVLKSVSLSSSGGSRVATFSGVLEGSVVAV